MISHRCLIRRFSIPLISLRNTVTTVSSAVKIEVVNEVFTVKTKVGFIKLVNSSTTNPVNYTRRSMVRSITYHTNVRGLVRDSGT